MERRTDRSFATVAQVLSFTYFRMVCYIKLYHYSVLRSVFESWTFHEIFHISKIHVHPAVCSGFVPRSTQVTLSRKAPYWPLNLYVMLRLEISYEKRRCRIVKPESVMYALLPVLSSHFIRTTVTWITDNVEFLYVMGVAAGLLEAFQEMFDNEDLQPWYC